MLIETRLTQIKQTFSSLTVDSLDNLIALYDQKAFFKDPFNEVYGKEAIFSIFNKMFTQVLNPRFDIVEHATHGHKACLIWEFKFQFKGSNTPELIRGATWLELNDDGLITSHRDYWDAAEELYEKIWPLSYLMKWLKRRI